MVRKTYKDFEAQHLLGACGYRVLDVYGGFNRQPLNETSDEVAWIPHRRRDLLRGL